MYTYMTNIMLTRMSLLLNHIKSGDCMDFTLFPWNLISALYPQLRMRAGFHPLSTHLTKIVSFTGRFYLNTHIPVCIWSTMKPPFCVLVSRALLQGFSFPPFCKVSHAENNSNNNNSNILSHLASNRVCKKKKKSCVHYWKAFLSTLTLKI